MNNARVLGHIARCVKLAREIRRHAWQRPKDQYTSEFRRVSKEAMQDARYWKELGDL